MRRIVLSVFRIATTCGRLWCLYLLVPYSIAAAQPSVFSSANFAAENPLAKIVVLPDDLPGGANSVLVLCQGFVETDGRLTNAYCGSIDRRALNAEKILIKRVLDTTSDQTFIPAKVDDEAVRVLMNFAVAIDCSLGSCVTIPVRNHGYYFKEYGPSYVSPQPILADDVWYEGFEYKLEWIDGWLRTLYGLSSSPMPGGAGLAYTMSVEIDTTGAASGESLDMVERRDWVGRRPPVGALEGATRSIGDIRFIPGFIDDEPVRMRLHERSIAKVMCPGTC